MKKKSKMADAVLEILEDFVFFGISFDIPVLKFDAFASDFEFWSFLE